jgi:uncharacterized circularly permuted ATP-grasp superfamily protein/uncharacterized alpha-E superfamily protein
MGKTSDLFDADIPGHLNIAQWAALAKLGHYDELRARVVTGNTAKDLGQAQSNKLLTSDWQDFFQCLGQEGFADLNRKTESLARQIKDNGITYNVYADPGGPQRPWSLDLFPMIVNANDWLDIERGVLQRVRLMEHIMANVYGSQTLLTSGLIPSALVHGHPGYIRAMHGVLPVGGNHLHIVSFDLARAPDGRWWLVSQRTQAPSGLGYLLENRLSISRLFPEPFEQMRVQHLAATYRSMMDGIRSMSPAGAQAHIALLTPGPYNETYFEHVYLARYLGLTLVQGSDLTVRDQKLYLRTLHKLEPVHGLIKRVDDAWLDPLELRADSTLGVPGLLQAIRAGNVLVVNAPGSGFLESSALLGFLPALSEKLLGEKLHLPAIPTWWCGEGAVLTEALAQIGHCVIKPTYGQSSNYPNFSPVIADSLSRESLDEWTGRIMREGDAYTLQSITPLSQMPTWVADPVNPQILPRSMMLRVFALADATHSWRVLPGGLARLVTSPTGVASMQGGGSSADVWVRTSEVDKTTLLVPQLTPAMVERRKRLITSRAAENLYWLGRYTERAENTIRLIQLTLECLNGEDPSSIPLLTWLQGMAENNAIVPPGAPSPLQSRRVFERALLSCLMDKAQASSLGFNLQFIKNTASAVRERLSQEQWRLTLQAEKDFLQSCEVFEKNNDFSFAFALRVLETSSGYLAAMTGAQVDRMTRDEGWKLLIIGRLTERLDYLSKALSLAFECDTVNEPGSFEALLVLFDSTITFHAHYQQSRELVALLELLVLNPDNPRSLLWVTRSLSEQIKELNDENGEPIISLNQWVPNLSPYKLDMLCDANHPLPHLIALIEHCYQSASKISDALSLRFFTHSQSKPQKPF